MDEIKIRQGDNSNKGIEKMYNFVQETKQNASRAEAKLHCVCLHQRGKNPALKRTNKTDADGNPEWICRRCGKVVRLQKLDPNELRKAISVVDQAIDVIKLLGNPENEKDIETLKKVSKMQYRLIDLPKLYDAAVRNDKPKRNNNPGPRGSSFKP